MSTPDTPSSEAKAKPSLRVLLRQSVETRDGVTLRTDLYLPPEGRVPVVLIRTPYGRNMPILLHLAQLMTRQGLGVLLQDSRGRYQSSGDFRWKNEEEDGWDTLAWLSDQPWFNGRIGLLGMSLSSFSNFRLAAQDPPEGVIVDAMVSIMGTADYRSMFYSGGALLLHWGLPWSSMMGVLSASAKNAWQSLPWDELFRRLPLMEVEVSQFDFRMWRQILSCAYHDPFWQGLSALDELGKIRAPTLHMAGWYDFMLAQTLLAHRQMSASGLVDQRLIIGPWNHENLFQSLSAKNKDHDNDLLGEAIGWLVRWLVDAESSVECRSSGPTSEVWLKALRSEGWIQDTEFPSDQSSERRWYLTSNGSANTLHGDGRLLHEQPAQLGQDRFLYDPHDPVPTVGGAIWPFAKVGLKPGRADQTEIEQREDVLVYTSSPLDEDLWAVGPCSVELWVSTSTADTDFTAKLVDVDLRDTPFIVVDAIARGRFHVAPGEETLLQPGRPCRLTIDLGVCGYRFRRGHQLRLEISSSNFPKYDRNINTAARLHSTAVTATAQQNVFHGGPMASCLRLHTLSNERLSIQPELRR